MEKIILLGVLLSPAVLIAFVVFWTYRFVFKRGTAKETAKGRVAPATHRVTVAVPEPEYIPAPMVVRDVQDGKGTVIIRYRYRTKVVTAHLIVWAGKKRRNKLVRYQDSYYDLGFFDAHDVTDEIVAKVLAEALTKLAELTPRRKGAGAKKEQAVSETVVAVVPEQVAGVASAIAEQSAVLLPAVAVAAVATAAAAVVVEDDGEHEPAIKMKKVPSVFRGVILDSGMMKRPLQDRIIESFGILYRTPEGIEDAVWGVDLRRALESAKATVGDCVEILKVGRKIIEKGKAPMNLYQIAKIGTAQAAA